MSQPASGYPPPGQGGHPPNSQHAPQSHRRATGKIALAPVRPSVQQVQYQESQYPNKQVLPPQQRQPPPPTAAGDYSKYVAPPYHPQRSDSQMSNRVEPDQRAETAMSIYNYYDYEPSSYYSQDYPDPPKVKPGPLRQQKSMGDLDTGRRPQYSQDEYSQHYPYNPQKGQHQQPDSVPPPGPQQTGKSLGPVRPSTASGLQSRHDDHRYYHDHDFDPDFYEYHGDGIPDPISVPIKGHANGSTTSVDRVADQFGNMRLQNPHGKQQPISEPSQPPRPPMPGRPHFYREDSSNSLSSMSSYQGDGPGPQGRKLRRNGPRPVQGADMRGDREQQLEAEYDQDDGAFGRGTAGVDSMLFPDDDRKVSQLMRTGTFSKSSTSLSGRPYPPRPGQGQAYPNRPPMAPHQRPPYPQAYTQHHPGSEYNSARSSPLSQGSSGGHPDQRADSYFNVNPSRLPPPHDGGAPPPHMHPNGSYNYPQQPRPTGAVPSPPRLRPPGPYSQGPPPPAAQGPSELANGHYQQHPRPPPPPHLQQQQYGYYSEQSSPTLSVYSNAPGAMPRPVPRQDSSTSVGGYAPPMAQQPQASRLPQQQQQPAAPVQPPSPPPALHDLGFKYQIAKTSKDQYERLEIAQYILDHAKDVAAQEANPKARAKRYIDLCDKALKLMNKVKSSGRGGAAAEAVFLLASAYFHGQYGLKKDQGRAFELYQLGAKQSHPEATYRTAVCYELGAGCRKDHGRAIQFYRKSASQGCVPAMYKLGLILLKGLLSTSPAPREAITWLKRAGDNADEKYPHALHELANCYERGGIPGLIEDEAYAKELHTKAAQLNYVPSQVRLGLAYEYGTLGCPIDARKSIGWYTRAAERGDHDAELALSGWYLTGAEGVLPQNDVEAYLWAQKAAEGGLPKAEYAMGYYTESGIGTPQGANTIEQAMYWYRRAAQHNNKRAVQRLTELKHMGHSPPKPMVRPKRGSKGLQDDGCKMM
ncbi:hypothetical protein H4219_003211 [Mycoemilia scoparia]|uniref:Uncharacterized protein n=1 Tax=Mycoemilia scoparia TaxID=417184 RepID=A0A9W7ZW63_9FUNG|nr:hypothetical protein H4219_003211 [Mycoemilia scoparia]